MIPFRAIPYRLRYCAENLSTTRLYCPFQRCPPLAHDNKGRYTKKSKHILAMWEANKSLFGGLFHNPVPNGTHAQDLTRAVEITMEEVVDDVGEEIAKGA